MSLDIKPGDIITAQLKVLRVTDDSVLIKRVNPISPNCWVDKACIKSVRTPPKPIVVGSKVKLRGYPLADMRYTVIAIDGLSAWIKLIGPTAHCTKLLEALELDEG